MLSLTLWGEGQNTELRSGALGLRGRPCTLQLGANVLVTHPATPLPPRRESPRRLLTREPRQGTSRDQVVMCYRMVAPAFRHQWGIIVRGLNPSSSIILGTWQGLIQTRVRDLL